MVMWLPFYLVHEQHLSMQVMAKTAALYFLVVAASSLATGWLADSCMRRGLTTTVVRRSAMAIGWTTAVVGFTGYAFTESHSYFRWFMVAGVGCGIGGSGVFAFSQTLAGPQAAGRWTALQSGLANFAGMIAPALTGFLLDWTGHFHIALAITAGVCLFGALSWVFWVGPVKPVIWSPQIAVEPV